MSIAREKLARALEALKSLQESGHAVLQSHQLSRGDREVLLKGGFFATHCERVVHPYSCLDSFRDSTTWYTSFWDFVRVYCTERFESGWCCSAEQSILLQVGRFTVPRQLVVHASKGSNRVLELLFETSLLDMKTTLPAEEDIVQVRGVRCFSLPLALVRCSPRFFSQYPNEAKAALLALEDKTALLRHLLKGHHTWIAGRLAGAFRTVGLTTFADAIVQAFSAAGADVREADPFQEAPTTNAEKPVLLQEGEPPFVTRLRLAWKKMREDVLENFGVAPAWMAFQQEYLDHVREGYAADAYHSLSIEGYRVDPELIEKVRKGRWSPEYDPADRERYRFWPHEGIGSPLKRWKNRFAQF